MYNPGSNSRSAASAGKYGLGRFDVVFAAAFSPHQALISD